MSQKSFTEDEVRALVDKAYSEGVGSGINEALLNHSVLSALVAPSP